MTIEKYFNTIESLLDHHWAILGKQIEYIRFAAWRGKIDGRIFYTTAASLSPMRKLSL